ncbi:ATP-grasp domain-containing protein [Streptomyces sp. NPDC059452]|uniref:ATP-grasp domain-containing protein n=1 Tax=Streptomyces sp. NPDC059452 TaxID=3346835 RepID=UPI00368C1806
MSIIVLHKGNASRRSHLEKAAEYAKRNGDRLLLVMKDPTWEKEFADALVSVDTSDVEATVAATRALAAAETEPIRAVVAFVGHTVPAASAVAADLGLRFVSEQVARKIRDKYAMREAFTSGNVPQPVYGLARTLEEAATQAARIGFPLVLKPLIDNDTGYFRRVDSMAELTEYFPVVQRGAWSGIAHNPLYAWMAETYDSAILLEEYLSGAEVSVESIVVDGRAHVVAIHDKPVPMEGPYFVDVHYATPSRLSAEVQERIVELTAASHRAVGIDTGAVHTEFRIQSDGTPKILETAARLGGGPVYQSVLLSTGVDMVAAVLDVASGRTPDLLPKPTPTPAGFYLFFAEKAGRISEIRGVEEAGRNPCVHEISLYRKVGESVDVPPHVWQSHGHVIFTADSDNGLVETFEKLVNSIRIEIE